MANLEARKLISRFLTPDMEEDSIESLNYIREAGLKSCSALVMRSRKML